MLVCCVDKTDGCICQADPVCGGIHIFEPGCQGHGTRGAGQFKSTIHEAGEKRTTVVLVAPRKASAPLT